MSSFARNIHLTLSGCILAAGFLAQTSAHAVALTAPVGNFADTALPGTTVALRPELAGTVLADDITPFTFQGIAGTVQSRVVRETASGTLDFYWKVNVNSSETGAGVSAFRLIDFGYGHLQDADWRIDGVGTVAPDTARLFSSASQPSGAVNFLFDEGIAPGSASRLFFLHTEATAFSKTAMFDMLTTGPQNLSGIYQTYAPAVPEPATWALVVAGVAIAGLASRRR